MIIRNFLMLMFVATLQITAFSQYSTTALWTSAKVNYKFLDDFKISLENTYRIQENMSELSKVYFETGLSYKVSKFVDIQSEYRFSINSDIPVNDFENKFALGISLDYDIKRFKLTTRTKYQVSFTNFRTDDEGNVPDKYLRNKLKLEYNVRKKPLDPYFYYEFFFYVGNMSVHEIDKQRFTLGFDYKLNKRNDLDFAYIIQNSQKGKNAGFMHIIAISYNFSL